MSNKQQKKKKKRTYAEMGFEKQDSKVLLI